MHNQGAREPWTRAAGILFPDVVLWVPRLVIPQSVGCFQGPTGAGLVCPPS